MNGTGDIEQASASLLGGPADSSAVGTAAPTSADPSAASATAPTGIPTMNPADSPYQPLNLPDQTPKQLSTPGEDPSPEQVQAMGAMNRGGAIAMLASHALRGFGQIYNQHQQQQAMAYNKKLTAQQSIYNDQSKQYIAMAKSGIDPKSPEFQQAQARVKMSWDAVMSTVGERIPQETKGSKRKQGGQGQGGQGQGQGQAGGGGGQPGQPGGQPGPQGQELLQRAIGGDISAVHQIALQTGPPVFYQAAPFMTPQYQAKMRQAAQTESTTAATAGVTADTQSAAGQITNKLAHAVASGAPQAEIDKLIKQRDELAPSPKFPVGGEKRYRKGADGIEHQYMVDQEGREIDGTDRPLSMAGQNPSAPKVGSLGEFLTALYGPKPNPRQEVEGKKLWSPEVQTIGTHTVMVWNGLQEVPLQIQTTSTKGSGGTGSVPNVRADGGKAAAPAAAPGTTSTAASTSPHAGDADYQNWLKTNHQREDPTYNTYGAYKAGEKPTANGHMTDKYKLATHPTYSTEALSSQQPGAPPAGEWTKGNGGKWKFKATQTNVDNVGGVDGLKQYFDRVEPGNTLVLPDGESYTGNAANAKHHSAQTVAAPPAKAPPSAAPSAAPSASTHKPASNAGVISTGQPVGYKFSPATTTLLKNAASASTAFQGAQSAFSEAQRDAPAAKTANGGVARMNILAGFLKSLGSHTAGVSGSQVRLTNVEWQYAMQSAPLLQRAASHFGVTSDGTYTVLSGITLSPEQINGIVMEMGRKALTAKQTWLGLQKQALAAQQTDRQEGLAASPSPASSSTPSTHSDLDKEILNLMKR